METNKIYQGDCIDLLRNIKSESIDMIIIDPPYGTKTNPRDTFMIGEFSNVMPLVLNELHRVLKKDGAFYCFISWSMMSDWLLRYQQYFKMQNLIIWSKGKHSGCYSSQSWQFRWEGIFFGIKGKRKIREWQSDVIEVKDNEKEYALQKPREVIKKLLMASSDEGDLVLDCFMGSGTTAVACIENKRNFIGIEINPEYCNIANNRIKEALAQSKLCVVEDLGVKQ